MSSVENVQHIKHHVTSHGPSLQITVPEAVGASDSGTVICRLELGRLAAAVDSGPGPEPERIIMATVNP